MFSCNSTDCTNGVQDGNETGVDCGGDCPNCVTPPAPSGILGDWHFHRMDLVQYSNGEIIGTTQSNLPSMNYHTFNANGVIYATGSTEVIGQHNGVDTIQFSLGMPFTVTSVNSTEMVAKEHPNGLESGAASEYYYKR